ncbi:peptidoglycan/xylan/chitin deacetylase (PgdA/CDA1 family) [Actinoplanes campanulatus]|uniref:Peptidoglycan/xylan/chitin deacetylase (PgdA/CDA1 family) n=1 Tax=Actinoplanes campanulatus TaxID=113559 RepID=A0A7W5AFA0_9ACTN|nr:polysaccharide deacetylase family protein [Actinoplanes campanulatus]MBB3094709.1 peptidoglycan/xylan/chitin deacetylase (PgdA/CDA1 family) [Actinoplanes campanulatus]GGN06940.1 polysaccharide deacetylase [Actinoplanes campanulatus]GID36006.1 polysaccharide deacetylase [Actinoplanes campanulatus]
MTASVAQAWTTLPALMYHSVSAVGGPLRDLAVPPERLAEQLAALSAAGYRLVGLTEALDELAAGSTEKMVAVTFDDGYRDFLTAGVPALQAAGAGATLYASVGHLGGHAGWLGQWSPDFGPMLTWSELEEVASTGIEIGNHSLIHHPLDVLSGAQLREEVVSSHDQLEQRLQRKVRSFAYPHGYNSDRVRRVVESSGHDNATEVGRRLHTPSERRFAVPRFQPTPDHTGADLVALVEGGGPRLVSQIKQLAQPGWRLVRRMARKAGRNLT